MEEFNELMTKLETAARAGEFAKVRDILKDEGKEHALWQPTGQQEKCLEVCKAACKGEETEEYLKGWVVTSINEWGHDQERVLILTTQAVYRCKFDFNSNRCEHANRTALSSIIRIEHGHFAAKGGLTGFIWKKAIEQQQGIRMYTHERDGGRSINDVKREDVDPKMFGKTAPVEFSRTYRAFNAENEPWKEEVFVREVAAALTAASHLNQQSAGGKPLDIKHTALTKEVPGGVFSMMYNGMSMGKYHK